MGFALDYFFSFSFSFFRFSFSNFTSFHNPKINIRHPPSLPPTLSPPLLPSFLPSCIMAESRFGFLHALLSVPFLISKKGLVGNINIDYLRTRIHAYMHTCVPSPFPFLLRTEHNVYHGKQSSEHGAWDVKCTIPINYATSIFYAVLACI